MQIIQFLFKTLYKIKWILIFGILIAGVLAYYLTSNMQKTYKVSCTVYTGIASGYNIESEGSKSIDFNTVNNGMDNLINVIKSRNTLEMVSLRLVANSLIKGNAQKDNNDILSINYNTLYNATPNEIKQVIKGDDNLVIAQRLLGMIEETPTNYLYRVLNTDTPFFSYNALSTISIRRLSSSDMLDISYECSDPGIAYNTITLLNEEYIKQYQKLQFGETDSVIAYFQSELQKCNRLLKLAEDSLIQYNVRNQVINYEEQTKQMAVQSRDFNLEYTAAQTLYNSALNLVSDLETKMKFNEALMKDNNNLLKSVEELSGLTYQKTYLSVISGDQINLDKLNDSIRIKQNEVSEDLDVLSPKYYSREGLSADEVIKEWFLETLNVARAKATIDGLIIRKEKLDKDYNHYSPVGAILKRKEREINFLENLYLNLQNGLNTALTRKKSLQMSTGTLTIINPPALPIEPLPSKRAFIMLASVLAVALFILTYYIAVDLIDQSLRDLKRAEKMTGMKVLGGFAAPFTGRYHKYQNEGYELSATYLYNAISPYLKNTFPNVILFTSIDKGAGKSFIADALMKKCMDNDLTVEFHSWNSDMSQDQYIWADSWKDICKYEGNQIVILELPPLEISTPNKYILNSVDICLMVITANSVWNTKDELYAGRISNEISKGKLFVYLNLLSRDAMMDIVGMMPPYTKVRSMFYRIFSFQLKKK
ncbi:MAG: GumC family protein [Bacteroidales bacterium]